MAKGKYKEWLEPDGLLKLEAWARDGLTDEQIANNMKIVTSTLYEWKKKYPIITESLKKGKEVVDIEVENALFKRAVGYEYEEKKEEFEDGKLKKTIKITKRVLPDTVAQIFWLRNRKPNVWRNKIEVTNDDTKAINENLLEIASLINNPQPNRELKVESEKPNE